MCGSNNSQADAQAQEAAFSKQMVQENATVYGKQQGILDSLNAGFHDIIAKGPSQQGFSPGERTDLDTTATESVAGNMRKASQALGEGQAAEGGGDTFIPSGGKDQQREELVATGARTDAELHTQIAQDDYATGRANYDKAVSGDLAVGGMQNSVGFADAATSANTASANEANAIAASANSPFTAVMGALGGVAGTAAGAYMGK